MQILRCPIRCPLFIIRIVEFIYYLKPQITSNNLIFQLLNKLFDRLDSSEDIAAADASGSLKARLNRRILLSWCGLGLSAFIRINILVPITKNQCLLILYIYQFFYGKLYLQAIRKKSCGSKAKCSILSENDLSDIFIPICQIVTD